ncbi:LLM class flavin-dependent oxidoreductase [Nocardioides antri]|uniref:LLM class flavin-dependent oxidoreductase n=1 Tax=Nocardioides antri TaxID=2607659 RepID=A0A5B1M004_9ACTN|nr:LLM class flavin-dependent oxidoreductase [Nocardioides antri]
MEVGVALPQMARHYAPETTVDWARAIDDGPFSSLSAGERVTFPNPDMVASLAAAAAVTSRVRIMTNVWVLPAHPIAMVAQQVGTLDQLAGGRLVLGVGIGGRDGDYDALGASTHRRHQRLDEQVRELRRLLDGQPPYPRADPVGPALADGRTPELLAGALGPKALARAARWADGVTGFSVTGARQEFVDVNTRADAAWAAAGRGTPRKVTGCFYALGVPDPEEVLRDFAERYLGFLGPELATAFAGRMTAHSPDRVRRVLDDAEAAGCDEVVLVPASVDLRCLDAAAELVAAR